MKVSSVFCHRGVKAVYVFPPGGIMKSRAVIFTVVCCCLVLPLRGSDVHDHGRSSRIVIQSPLAGERFITNETIHLQASVAGHGHMDKSELVWTSSSVPAVLGRGTDIQIGGLPAGTHNISVSFAGETETVSIREFKDLEDLYQAPPSPKEVRRILDTFSFHWIDGPGPDEKWASYEPPTFDQASFQPSKLPVVARLDVLRHQAFSEPLPCGDGLSIYDHFRKYVNTVDLRLDCSNSSGGGGRVSLGRFGSVWWNSYKDTCKTPSPSDQGPAPYVDPLYLLVHEARHGESGAPGHTSCNGMGNMDASLDGGSGHAWPALYVMWVYNYWLYDPPPIKQEPTKVAHFLP